MSRLKAESWAEKELPGVPLTGPDHGHRYEQSAESANDQVWHHCTNSKDVEQEHSASAVPRMWVTRISRACRPRNAMGTDKEKRSTQTAINRAATPAAGVTSSENSKPAGLTKRHAKAISTNKAATLAIANGVWVIAPRRMTCRLSNAPHAR